MVAIARAGVNFSDPREFCRGAAAANALGNFTAGSTSAVSTAAGFFTEQARRGVADNTNWTASTYKTILNISSGMGLVSNLIGPTGLAGTPTTTFEITVDGAAPVTIAVTQTTTGHRSFLGGTQSTAAMFTTVNNSALGPDSLSADATTPTYTTNVHYLLPWETIRFFGMPCLIFRQSLLIRMQSSESNSTTTNNERQSCVQYMVMQ